MRLSGSILPINIFIALLIITAAGCNMPKGEKMDYVRMPHLASVNSMKMYYEIYGEGETPLVLIHGGGSTIDITFKEIIPMLAKHRKIIAVELQAHGHSGDRNAPESFEQDADDVAELMNVLKVSKADFLGFSNGGNTAMQIGMRHPEIVNKLVIISAFYKRAGLLPGLFDGLQAATIDNMPEPLKKAYLDIKGNTQQGLENMFEKDRNRMLQYTDWTDESLQSIKAPALVMAGDKDIVLPEHTAAMARLIPNARLAILPGAHGEFIGEALTGKKGSQIPQAAVTVIEEFLND